ncbi:sterol 24-C-methyltransferase [Aureococcus anophagefferens]|nr:sterol 24-C-methyltransferase [Aureococcus anophagefferens]
MSWLLLAASATALTAPRRTAVAPRAAVALQGRSDAQLKRGIAEFYDESSGIWEDVWGEHMHHGWYEPGEKAGTMERDVAAQSTMIDKALELCGAADVAARCEAAGRPMRILDVGCGIGGSSRHMARRFAGAQATCVGLTLSPEQARAQRAQPRGRLPERAVLGLINYCYYLPKWCSGADYARLFAAQRGVTARSVRDWTANIAPFWPAVARSSLKWSSLKKLRKTGLKTIRGAVAILFMILGRSAPQPAAAAAGTKRRATPRAWSGPVFKLRR